MNKEFMTIITGPAGTGKTMYLDKLACESDKGRILIDPYNTLSTYLENFAEDKSIRDKIITLDFSKPETFSNFNFKNLNEDKLSDYEKTCIAYKSEFLFLEILKNICSFSIRETKIAHNILEVAALQNLHITPEEMIQILSDDNAINTAVNNAEKYLKSCNYALDTGYLKKKHSQEIFQRLRRKLKESVEQYVPHDFSRYKFTGNINILKALQDGKLIHFTMNNDNSLLMRTNFLYAYILYYAHIAFLMFNDLEVYIDDIYNSMTAMNLLKYNSVFYAYSRRYKVYMTTENLSVIRELYNMATEYGLEIVQL